MSEDQPTRVIFRGSKIPPGSAAALGNDEDGDITPPSEESIRPLASRAFSVEFGPSLGITFTKAHIPGEAYEQSNLSLKARRKRIFAKIVDVQHDRIMNEFVIVNLVFVIFGCVSLLTTMTLHFIEDDLVEFLSVNHKQQFMPIALMYLEGALSIVIGIWAIIAFYKDYTLFLILYNKILWIILGSNMCSTFISFGNWKHFNKAAYERIFEAQATFFADKGDKYLKLWGDKYIGFWDRLQPTMRCCGMHEPMDWLTLANDIPDSCCRTRHDIECLPMLKSWRTNKSGIPTTDLLALMYPTDCANILEQEILNLQRDWAIFPIIIFFFNVMLMIFANCIIRDLRNLYRTIGGRHSIEDFKAKLFGQLRTRKLRFRRKKHHDNIATVDSVQSPSDMDAADIIGNPGMSASTIAGKNTESMNTLTNVSDLERKKSIKAAGRQSKVETQILTDLSAPRPQSDQQQQQEN